MITTKVKEKKETEVIFRKARKKENEKGKRDGWLKVQNVKARFPLVVDSHKLPSKTHQILRLCLSQCSS